MIDLQLYRIANHYGLEPQLNQLQEECAELIQAINKYRRLGTETGEYGFSKRAVPSGVIEEIADVEIMLSQARILLGENVSDEIDRRKEDKIRRQISLIESEVRTNDK